MTKNLLALIVLAASAQTAMAGPADDELDKLIASKGLVNRLGESIQHATDRAAALVSTAMGSIGVPYRRGGNSAETGFDCSGFVRSVYQQTVGMLLPRRAEEQAAATHAIAKNDLQPGDLVFFNTMRRAYSHVGIYLGDGKFIHSPRTGSQVRVESMNVSYWQSRFDGARRVLADAGSQANVATVASNEPSRAVIERESPAPRTVRLGGSFGKFGFGAARSSQSVQEPASASGALADNI